MKKLIISVLIAIASFAGNAQSTTDPQQVHAAQATQVSIGTFTVKSTGEVLPVYKGSKGGLYCFRVSGKTGLPYKQYLKPEQVTMN